jgi:hypothetical protein
VIPDHDYHTFWATPNSASSDFTTQTVDLSTSSFSTQTTDIEISVDDKSFQTTFDSRSVGVQVDTFSSNSTTLRGIHMRQQQRLVHDLKLKVKNLTTCPFDCFPFHSCCTMYDTIIVCHVATVARFSFIWTTKNWQSRIPKQNKRKDDV